MRSVQTEDGSRNWITTGWVKVKGQWCEQGYFEGSALPTNPPDLPFDRVADRLNSNEVTMLELQNMLQRRLAKGAIETRDTTRLILGDCYEEAVRPFREQLVERHRESGEPLAKCAVELCLILEAQERDSTLVVCALVEEAGA